MVSANCKPKWILNAFKANATRTMREADCWHSENSPWVRRGSKRYLWTEQQLLAAMAYVPLIKVNLTMSTSAQVESGIRWLQQAAL